METRALLSLATAAAALATPAAAALAAGGAAADPCPAPGPWNARAWVGAALYVVLFLAALAGVAALLRGPGDAPGPR